MFFFCSFFIICQWLVWKLKEIYCPFPGKMVEFIHFIRFVFIFRFFFINFVFVCPLIFLISENSLKPFRKHYSIFFFVISTKREILIEFLIKNVQWSNGFFCYGFFFNYAQLPIVIPMYMLQWTIKKESASTIVLYLFYSLQWWMNW